MKTVIFSSPYAVALCTLILLLYVGVLVIQKNVKRAPLQKKLSTCLTAVNIAAHLALFAVCLVLKTPAEELFFVLVASAAMALTVTSERKGEA